jgi:hypothetical protein
MREKTISIKMATAAIVSLVLGALLLTVPVFAAGGRVPALSGEKSSITVKLCYVDGSRSTPIGGAKMAIYQVASLAVRGGGAVYTATPAYASAGIHYEGMTAAASNKAAAKLAGLAKAQRPRATASTDAGGQARFTGLDPGIYLVMQTGAEGAAKGYETLAPYLVMAPAAVPTDNGNRWQYQVVSLPKPDVVPKAAPPANPPKPHQPPETRRVKTGDAARTSLWVGSFLVATALLLLAVDRRRQRTTE